MNEMLCGVIEDGKKWTGLWLKKQCDCLKLHNAPSRSSVVRASMKFVFVSCDCFELRDQPLNHQQPFRQETTGE
jgi:hypothetical protein